MHDLWEDDEEVWRNGEYLTTVLGDRAAEFITRTAPEGPFFCYVPFNAPHYPMHAPAEHMDRVAHLPPGRRETAAMIAAMDDAIGVILEASGTRDDTLVLFSSDNGPSRESRNWLGGEEISYEGGSTGGLRGSKGSIFEGGIRVPCIMSWPSGLPTGEERDLVGLMMDVVPTVLHAADGAAPTLPDADGLLLLEALRDGTDPGERPVYWTYQGQYAVRRGRYKLVAGPHEGMDPPAVLERALFDLDADPEESVDIAGREPEVVAELERDLEAYRVAA